MKIRKSVCLAVLAAAPLCYAVITGNWTEETQASFEKGTVTGLSIRNDGRLTLAPVFSDVFDAASTYLWAVAEDGKGNIYTGGGGPADDNTALFLIGPDGQGKKLAELPGLQIQAIAIGPKGNIFAATSPDGKVYRVTQAGESAVFFDPQAKYIWAMAFGRDGDLYVATGDEGKVFRVKPDGAGTMFFDTQETHARSLAIEKDGSLLVGSEPGGLIFRVSPEGRGFVLYQADRREVSAIAVKGDGAIFFAAVGGKRQQPSMPSVAPPVAQPVTPQSQTAAVLAAQQSASQAVQGQTSRTQSRLLLAPSGGADVYQIDPRGYTKEIWSDSRAIVYSIVLDSSWPAHTRDRKRGTHLPHRE